MILAADARCRIRQAILHANLDTVPVMHPFTRSIPRRLLGGLVAALLLLVSLAACDAVAPDDDASTLPRTGTLAPAFSVNETMMAGGVLFDGLRHRAVGDATLEVDPATGRLIVSSLQSAQGGMSGFRTRLGKVRGVERAFEGIDLLNDFDEVTWRLGGVLDESVSEIARLRLLNQGGAVDVQVDLSAFGPTVEVHVFDGDFDRGSVVVPSRGLMASVQDNGAGVELARLRFKAPDGEFLAVSYTSPVVVMGPAFMEVGDQIRVVVPDGAGKAAADPMVLTDEVWQFNPGAGATQGEVVSTGVAVGAFFLPEPNDEVLQFHSGVGPAEMRVDAASPGNTTIDIRNRGRRGAMAGVFSFLPGGATGPQAMPDAFSLGLQGVHLNAPNDAFAFELTGTIGQTASKTVMAEPTLLGRAELRRQGQDTIVCITYPDFVATYNVQAVREAAVLFEETVAAGACATLPARLQQILGVWTDRRPPSFALPDLGVVAKGQGNGGPVQIRIHPLDSAPGEVSITGVEITSTGAFKYIGPRSFPN